MVLLTATLYFVFVQSSVDRLVPNYVVSAYSSQGALVRVAMNLPPAIIFLAALWLRSRFPEIVDDDVDRRAGVPGAADFFEASTAIKRLALCIIPLQIMVLSRLPAIFGRSVPATLLLTVLLALYSAAILFVVAQLCAACVRVAAL